MLIRDPSNTHHLLDQPFDVCIVGAGAAGLTIANELNGSPLSALLLEAGSLEVSAASQELYKGEEDTQRMPESYLSTSRLRVFGGTTGHWAGEGRRLDAIDFEQRDWIPHSGWPITRNDLDPYYRRSAAYCRFPPDLPASGTNAAQTMIQPRHLFRASSPIPRFGTDYLDAVEKSENVLAILCSAVVEIRSEGNGVSSVTVVSAGRRSTVRASYFVLAAGTIENARLLLNSVRLDALRLHQEHDVVGRFFMDHGEGPVAAMRFPEGSGADMEFLLGSTERTTGARYIPALWLSERGQRSTRAANVAFEVVPDGVGSSAADARANPAQIARASLGAMSRLPDWLSDSRAEAATYFRLVFRCESRPDPTNHVTLTDHLDALGVPRVKLSYRWQPADLASIAPALGLLAREFGERYGILVKQFAEPSEVVRTSFHQMGTTRMGADPGRSVVDAECRVHSCANLFVAGGSVFPSAGWVNPTMTIVALAIRLADLLKRVAKQ